MTPDQIHRWLVELRVEHRNLDALIRTLSEQGEGDLIRIQRLKKRKLQLKDTITRLESQLIPDMDA